MMPRWLETFAEGGGDETAATIDTSWEMDF